MVTILVCGLAARSTVRLEWKRTGAELTHGLSRPRNLRRPARRPGPGSCRDQAISSRQSPQTPSFGRYEDELRRCDCPFVVTPGSSSPSSGGLPCPTRARVASVRSRSARRARVLSACSVRSADSFSATATLISWFRATPSSLASCRASSSSEGKRRRATLLRRILRSPPARADRRAAARGCRTARTAPRGR